MWQEGSGEAKKMVRCHSWMMVLLMLLLASWGPEASQPGIGTATAATPVENPPPQRADPPSFPLEEYQAMKAAFLDVYGFKNGVHETPPTSESIDITPCDSSGEHISGYRPSLTAEPMPLLNHEHENYFEPSGNMYLALANEVAYATVTFDYYSVPESLWSSRLSEAEKESFTWLVEKKISQSTGKDSPLWDEFAAVQNRALEQLASDVSSHYRERGVIFSTNFECGGTDWALFALKGDAKIRRLFLLTRWNALVCKNVGIDPMDMKKCRGWRPVSAPTSEIAGDMYFTALWSDGEVTSGPIIFNNRPEGNYEVTIRKSGPGFRTLPDDSVVTF